MKYAVGQRLKVMDNSDATRRCVGSHNFENGITVVVLETRVFNSVLSYYCRSEYDGDLWWVTEFDVKPMKPLLGLSNNRWVKPINDGSTGWRYNFGLVKGIIRVRKEKKRWEITKGKDMNGVHFGRYSVYFSKNKKSVRW